MLSLSPRYDLFRFALPKTFIPEKLVAKYQAIISREAGVLTTPIDYLNESIVGINIPGISDLTVDQVQHSHNSRSIEDGSVNVEPQRQNTYKGSANPLDRINKEITLTFRLNQGFLNYFMVYETIFWRTCKPIDAPEDDVLMIELMDENGTVNTRIKFFDCHLNGIDGLDFNYSKIERESGTFDITFKFNNIDFEFVDQYGKGL